MDSQENSFRAISHWTPECWVMGGSQMLAFRPSAVQRQLDHYDFLWRSQNIRKDSYKVERHFQNEYQHNAEQIRSRRDWLPVQGKFDFRGITECYLLPKRQQILERGEIDIIAGRVRIPSGIDIDSQCRPETRHNPMESRKRAEAQFTIGQAPRWQNIVGPLPQVPGQGRQSPAGLMIYLSYWRLSYVISYKLHEIIKKYCHHHCHQICSQTPTHRLMILPYAAISIFISVTLLSVVIIFSAIRCTHHPSRPN